MRAVEKFLVFHTFAFLFLGSASVSVGPTLGCHSKVGCVQAFQNLQKELGKTRISDNYLADGLSEIPTVQITSHMPGPHGGQLLILRKIGEHWVSASSSVKNCDPQEIPVGLSIL